jgi:predicted SnoaL-like aldol condensation-catalyzing enzyme
VNSRPDGPQAAPAHPEPGHPAPAEVASAYLTAFYTGDFEAARPLLTQDFSFHGPFVQLHGRDRFLDSAAGLKPIVRGHRLLRQWADGGEVCSWYDVDLQTPVTSGAVTMSEWHAVRGGKLVSGRVVFDAAAFRAFLPPQ